jgi:hypothetical protein
MSFAIGDVVATKNGKIGRLLGILAGVAHIGLPDKKIVMAHVADIVHARFPDPVPVEIKPLLAPVEKKEDPLVLCPGVSPPVKPVVLSDTVEVRDELEIVQLPVELGEEDKKFIEGRKELEAIIVDSVRIPAEVLNSGVKAPENMTREWLTNTPLTVLKEVLEADKTLSAPRKSKIRKAIRERENGQQPVVEPEGPIPGQ